MTSSANPSKPLLIYGWGIHLAGVEKEAVEYAHRTQIPVVCTWGAIDLFKWDDPLYFGGFGTHGNKYSNLAVQNATDIFTFGTRLDTKATGSPAKDFAPKAVIHMTDIDQAEINKFQRMGLYVEGHCVDLRTYFSTLRLAKKGHYPEWIAQLNQWKKDFPSGMDIGGLNPYKFIEKLSDYLSPNDVIVCDTGCSLGWVCQVFKFNGQRLIHAFNNTPMGYGLPAAIGAAFATAGRILLVTGDGGLAVNITEFATVARHNLPIKIILFNNKGHAMCRQTQRTWMGPGYPSTSFEGGLACPNFSMVAKAYGIPAYSASTLEECLEYEGKLTKLLYDKGPGFLNLDIPLDYQVSPQVKFGKSLDDPDYA